jgi:ketosteroid isomerase-like protein
MSRENVELSRQASDAVNRRDLATLLALMDDDVETVSLLVAVEGSYHGRDGVRRWWTNLLDAFPDYAAEVLEVRDLGDLTVAALSIRGHGAGSDTPVELMVWVAARWRRGKCIWWRAFETQAEALEAVGLSE